MSAAGNVRAWRLFELAQRPWMAFHLRIHVTGVQELPRNARVLLVANHESFWDGFVLRHVQRHLRPREPFYAVMLERELARRRWLERLGALGVTPGSHASVRRLVERVRALPARSTLAYFPQGTIRPGSPRPLDFVEGVTSLARLMAPACVVPVAIRALPGRTRRTEVYVSLGPALGAAHAVAGGHATLETAVARELDAIEDFVARHGERAPERWPAPHAALRRDPHRTWSPRNARHWHSPN